MEAYTLAQNSNLMNFADFVESGGYNRTFSAA
jgi:hypothetical protein